MTVEQKEEEKPLEQNLQPSAAPEIPAAPKAAPPAPEKDPTTIAPLPPQMPSAPVEVHTQHEKQVLADGILDAIGEKEDPSVTSVEDIPEVEENTETELGRIINHAELTQTLTKQNDSETQNTGIMEEAARQGVIVTGAQEEPSAIKASEEQEPLALSNIAEGQTVLKPHEVTLLKPNLSELNRDEEAASKKVEENYDAKDLKQELMPETQEDNNVNSINNKENLGIIKEEEPARDESQSAQKTEGLMSNEENIEQQNISIEQEETGAVTTPPPPPGMTKPSSAPAAPAPAAPQSPAAPSEEPKTVTNLEDVEDVALQDSDTEEDFAVPAAPGDPGACAVPQAPSAPESPAAPAAPAVEEAEETVTKAPPPPSIENTAFKKAPVAPVVPAAAPAAPAPAQPEVTAAPPAPDATAIKTKHSFYGNRKADTEKKQIDHSIELADKEKHNWPLEVPLVPTFTFESMIIGANRFAHATAISVIDNPGNLYNPLVLHGATGTGKTHFLNAIGYALSKKYGQQNILMTNGVRFSRGIQRYVVEGKIEKFEELIRNSKAILIDDIHLTAVNEQNREYISKYLNTFLEENKQIVITSKYPPESLKKLEELIDFKLDGGWISELKVASGANHVKIVKKMLLDNGIEMTESDSEKFFNGMSLSVISRTIKRAKVLDRVLKSAGKQTPSYSVLFEKLLAVSGEDVESSISVKDFSQIEQIPNFGKGEWGKVGFFYPQDNANMMKWIAYSTGERAREMGIPGSYELALKSSYNPTNIISSAFKIANICDNKGLKGAVILGPSTDVCDPSVRENFYDILTHMLEIMLIRCGIINFENIKAPSTYVKVMAELLK
ncbi:hypothetical protein Dip510_000233 [Elusimicrobium posterum]|uniref:DnaA ATPase domain-containing protein n=1 Tax=Elusimicrobium posterum TaxID=3116653 RepID=UPI003C7376D1